MKVSDIDEKFLRKAGLSKNEQRVYAHYLALSSAKNYEEWVRGIGVKKFSELLEGAEEKVQKAMGSGK